MKNENEDLVYKFLPFEPTYSVQNFRPLLYIFFPLWPPFPLFFFFLPPSPLWPPLPLPSAASPFFLLPPTRPPGKSIFFLFFAFSLGFFFLQWPSSSCEFLYWGLKKKSGMLKIFRILVQELILHLEDLYYHFIARSTQDHILSSSCDTKVTLKAYDDSTDRDGKVSLDPIVWWVGLSSYFNKIIWFMLFYSIIIAHYFSF